MKNEILYSSVDDAILVAIANTPKTTKVSSASDFSNMNNLGFDENGEVTFTIYRTFDEKMKQKYQIRYKYKD